MVFFKEFACFCVAVALGISVSATAYAQQNHPERRGLSIDPEFLTPLPALEAASFDIDPLRSLVVTTLESVDQFSLTEVMDRIAAEGEPGLTGDELFRRWWDTNNTTSEAAFPEDRSQCDSGSVPTNGFFFECPRPEGQEAIPTSQTGRTANYIAIAAVNRIDLADRDGRTCGEQRLVFARQHGSFDLLDRNLLIFEASMPNPNPLIGVQGCKPIAEFWSSLSQDQFEEVDGSTVPLTPRKRGELLRDFFFQGIPNEGVEAPVSAANYGANSDGRGQIRSNQFAPKLAAGSRFEWLLREYKTELADGRLRIRTQTVKATPAVVLFEEDVGGTFEAKAQQLRDEIAAQLQKIMSPTRDQISFGPSDNLNMADSNSNRADIGDISTIVSNGKVPDTTIVGEMLNNVPLPAGMTPVNVLERIGAMTCAGCHEYASGRNIGGGIIWPDKQLRFVHISENPSEIGDSPNGDGPRFAISQAMHDPDNPSDGFLSGRLTVMQNVLAGLSN